MEYKISKDGKCKICKSENYNYVFSKETGQFIRWGSTFEDDPIMAPNGPEILDIEISTICHQGCSFCYKSNTSVGKNMSFTEFKEIFDKFDLNQLSQVALGIGSIDANEDLYTIMRYIRSCGVISNLTINGYRMKDSDYKNLAELAGAVAVSCYDKDVCFNCVEKLTEAGLKQVNIHMLFSNETYDQCMELIDLVQTDKRLENLNALVFLTVKEIGDRNTFTSVKDDKKYLEFVSKLIDSRIKYGFDSCASTNFINCLKLNYPEYHDKVINTIEACESSLFSSYVNVDGIFFPCSFAEHKVKGIDLHNYDKFNDIWNGFEIQKFRNMLITNERSCPMFNLKI